MLCFEFNVRILSLSASEKWTANLVRAIWICDTYSLWQKHQMLSSRRIVSVGLSFPTHPLLFRRMRLASLGRHCPARVKVMSSVRLSPYRLLVRNPNLSPLYFSHSPLHPPFIIPTYPLPFRTILCIRNFGSRLNKKLCNRKKIYRNVTLILV